MTAAPMILPFVQVDAFAHAPFTGNPAAVMPLDHWLADDVLQAIAQENNLAETAFTVPLPPGAGADYDLRWFTPTVEVALCGHATLASGHALMGAARQSLRLRTQQAGDLVVERVAGGEGDTYRLDLPGMTTAPADLAEIAALLGGPAPQETHARDGGYRLLVYADDAQVRALRPDFAALGKLGNLLIIATAPGAETDIVSRAFVPGAGIDEDPVTGSAHCLLTPYWSDRLGRDRFTAYQASARGGYLDCERAGDRVILTGRCRTVIEGQFLLSGW
ncbi:putative PhzF superfamily epimerase YddE/YHI9 [Sphingobium sp. B7D2B]|uniref:PhzF family phenazine biosynthesis protein n=1 Tax=Sphingobium sp. B7D2B TaxID=2940583 RepID=UPI0022258745|nr:PhzF family phenazine biosynthesis protein [Sphingobium sp. B7D2B]MCW2364921.1 putative PhzF superfamily epimerase YddE/YHI9 [Sphingobium sp. B7D2B]